MSEKESLSKFIQGKKDYKLRKRFGKNYLKHPEFEFV